MKDILLNIALFTLNDFVHENNIDCGRNGSYCKKNGRGFTYDLLTGDKGELIASVTFHKSQRPTFRYDLERLKK